MKIKLTNILAIISFTMLALGCKDDITPSGGEQVTDKLTEQIGHLAAYHNLSVPGSKGWKIEETPLWATPVNKEGAAGSQIRMLIESNINDSDREGCLKVRLADNSLIEYNLHQYSRLSDDNNARVNEEYLELTRGVGYAIDVFGQTEFGTEKYDMKYEVVNVEKLNHYLDSIGEPDAFIDEDRYYSESNSFVGSSISAVANKISVSAGIEGEIGAFKGSLSGSFEDSSTVNDTTGYALKEIKHVVGSRYLRAGVLREALANGGKDIFTSDFISKVEAMGDNPQIEDLRSFVNLFGTHIIVYGEIGGAMQLALEMHSTRKISERDISAALEITAGKAVSGGANVDIKDQTQHFASSSKISFCSFGGNNIIDPIYPGTDFNTAMQNVITAENLSHFVDGLSTKENAKVVDVKLIPLSSLIANENTAKRLHEYIVNDYQFEKTGNHSLKYAVSGFSTQDNYCGSLYLPEIDVRMEYYRESVPEISSDSRSTIVYSGTGYGMSYDVGFFLGDGKHKPGKLRKQRNGSFKYEPLDISLNQISTLYVDASGDLTLAPSGYASDYINKKFESHPMPPSTDISPAHTLKELSEFSPEGYDISARTLDHNKWSYFPALMRIVGRTADYQSNKEIVDFIKTGKAWINMELEGFSWLQGDPEFTAYYFNRNNSECGIGSASMPQNCEEFMDKNIIYKNGKLTLRFLIPAGATSMAMEIFPYLSQRGWGDKFAKDKNGNEIWPSMYLTYEDGVKGVTPRWR